MLYQSMLRLILKICIIAATSAKQLACSWQVFYQLPGATPT